MPVNFNTDSLNAYAKQINDFSKSSLVSSETNTRRKLIDPLIELLGWDFSTSEVILEYPIKIGSRTINVDFALSTDGKPIIFLEAKAFNVRLSDDYCDQIISYCRVEGVRWAGLTNGQSLKIFDTKRGRRIRDTLVSEIDLTEPTFYLNELSILHKQSILSGESETIVDSLLKRRNSVRRIKEGKDEIIDGFSKTLQNLLENYNLEQIQSISSQLASKAIELFENESGVVIIEPVSKQNSITKNESKSRNRTWKEQLDWAEPETKKIALKLKTEIEKWSNISGRASGSDYIFSKGESTRSNYFVALMVQKKRVPVRIRFDPNSSNDPYKLLKDRNYKWFFNGQYQEREFYVENLTDIDKALELITQSYTLT